MEKKCKTRYFLFENKTEIDAIHDMLNNEFIKVTLFLVKKFYLNQSFHRDERVPDRPGFTDFITNYKGNFAMHSGNWKTSEAQIKFSFMEIIEFSMQKKSTISWKCIF